MPFFYDSLGGNFPSFGVIFTHIRDRKMPFFLSTMGFGRRSGSMTEFCQRLFSCHVIRGLEIAYLDLLFLRFCVISKYNSLELPRDECEKQRY